MHSLYPTPKPSNPAVNLVRLFSAAVWLLNGLWCKVMGQVPRHEAIAARILTMDGANPRAEAIALSGGRIVAVGGVAEVLALKGATTQVIDAGGTSVLPGFIESHLHMFGGAEELPHLQVAGCSVVAAFVSVVAPSVFALSVFERGGSCALSVFVSVLCVSPRRA